MAPEQIVALRSVDRRADIYALGITIFEILSGRLPFRGNPAQVLFAHLNQPPTDLRQLVPYLPTNVAQSVMFGNCCTSYDIPLQLVVYSSGRTHRFEGGLAIFDWHFADGGRRVAFSQQTVHFSCSVHWELRNIASEKLVAAADIPEPCGQNPDPPKVKVPNWVTATVSGFK